MPIVLSQRIDLPTEYEDIPFFVYHFPRRYRNQIRNGDLFIYYQGDRYKKTNRYYFGSGVIGDVQPDPTGNTYFANLLEARRFEKNVPIYSPNGGFYESIKFERVRKRANPPWQSSIRPISKAAFSAITTAAGISSATRDEVSAIESGKDAIDVLRALNSVYLSLSPEERDARITRHLDRGRSVTEALKRLLGSRCQICGWQGFIKSDETEFIEAHHLMQIAERRPDSLCSENVILVCPNCHRELHYGRQVSVHDANDFIVVELSAITAKIRKNSIDHLLGRS